MSLHHVERRINTVSGFPRFDAEGATLLSDRDIKRRWAKFHDSIRSVSGNVLQRVIGRMLGEDTLRYKTARFFGRPVLRLVRSVRKRPVPTAVEPVVVQSQKAAARQHYFPVNYRIARHSLDPTLVEVHQQFSNVSTFVVNESVESAEPSVLALNELLATSSSEWLFLVDASVSEANRSVSLAALLSVAGEDDDVVFADENGPNPFTPILKSAGVGPHTLLSYNCVGRPALLRRSTLAALGGFRVEAGWVFEHDAYLRLKESGAHFRHVTAVLPAGRPDSSFEASHVSEDTCRVVRSALERRGMSGVVTPGARGALVHWRLHAPTPEPSIDIVIPTRDRIDLVRQCIEAIEEKTTYTNYDIIILDNDSKEPATLDYFDQTKYRVVPCPGPFNYAHIVNRGISHSSAEFVVTLNNDTILVTPDWLEQMVGLASQPDVSIVGACLLDQDGRREHESIVIAPYPQHLRTDSNYPHPDEFSAATRDVAAVTGAVQMVRRELWESLGGMDENLKVVMNDVDICLRSQDDGRYVVYTPDVQLYHHVSSSRGDLDPLDDRNRFIRRWDIFGTFKDPYFPESLLLLGETVYYRHQWD
ncbi:MAG: glycosyltransferase family 2 protein [Acidimicrobiales bacterium]